MSGYSLPRRLSLAYPCGLGIRKMLRLRLKYKTAYEAGHFIYNLVIQLLLCLLPFSCCRLPTTLHPCAGWRACSPALPPLPPPLLPGALNSRPLWARLPPLPRPPASIAASTTRTTTSRECCPEWHLSSCMMLHVPRVVITACPTEPRRQEPSSGTGVEEGAWKEGASAKKTPIERWEGAERAFGGGE